MERHELRMLLQHLHPDSPPDEAILDTLIERATVCAVAVAAIGCGIRGVGGVVQRRGRRGSCSRTHDVHMAYLLTSRPRYV